MHERYEVTHEAVMLDFEEPETATRFYDSHAYYWRAISEKRNDGITVYNQFFPQKPEVFAIRASEVTAQEMHEFSKKMNENWSAAKDYLKGR